MNTSELKDVISKIKLDYKKQKISGTEAKAQFENINWDSIVEDTCSKSSLKSVVNATVMLINLPKVE